MMTLTGIKKTISSKTVWGGLAAVESGALGCVGYATLSAEQVAAFILLPSIVSIAGGLFAIYGRVVATHKVK